MFGGSFLAGNAPLLFHFSEHKLQMVSAYGAGLLVGVSDQRKLNFILVLIV